MELLALLQLQFPLEFTLLKFVGFATSRSHQLARVIL